MSRRFSNQLNENSQLDKSINDWVGLLKTSQLNNQTNKRKKFLVARCNVIISTVKSKVQEQLDNRKRNYNYTYIN